MAFHNLVALFDSGRLLTDYLNGVFWVHYPAISCIMAFAMYCMYCIYVLCYCLVCIICYIMCIGSGMYLFMVLCVLLLHHVYWALYVLCYYPVLCTVVTSCVFCVLLPCIRLTKDCWLEVSIRKALRPAIATQAFFGYPVSISKR